MKNNDANENPSIESASNRDNPCFGTGPDMATLIVITRDEGSFQLPYAQFLSSRLDANPDLDNDPDAPPQRLVICFAMAEVVILGNGLRALEGAIQRQQLKFVQGVDRRYAAVLKTHVAWVSLAFAKEAP
jgi:hypothetical protein